jgi:hypothetical protein
MIRSGSAVLTCVLVAAGCSAPHAQEPRPHHSPPQEAIDACQGLSEGAACTVIMRGSPTDGTCRKGPDGESAVSCAPPHGDRPAPPPSTETQP